MLCQSACCGHLDALLFNDNFQADVPELAEILQPSTHPTTRPTHNLNGPEVATAHASAKPLCYIPHKELQGTPQEAKHQTPSDVLTNISLFHLLYYLI